MLLPYDITYPAQGLQDNALAVRVLPVLSELAPALSFFEVQPHSCCRLTEVSKTRSQIPTSALKSLAKAHESQYQKQEKTWATVCDLLQLYDAHTAPPVNN